MDTPIRRTPFDPSRNTGGYDLFVNSSYGDVFGAAFDETLVTNPTQSLLRLADRDGDEDKLSAEDANAQYGIGNLKFDAPVSARRAQKLHDMKKAAIMRQEIYNTGPQNFRSGALKFGAGLVGSVIDPLNIAAALIPGVGLTKAAGAATKAGISAGGVMATAGRAAALGAAEAAVFEPMVFLSAKRDQVDYSIADSLANIAFGGILSGGAAGIGRALQLRGEMRQAEMKKQGEAQLETIRSEFRSEMDRLDLEDRREVFKTAFSEMAQDQFPRNVDAVMQRVKIERAVTNGLSEVTFKADGQLSVDNISRLQSRSGGKPVAAIPVGKVFDSRKEADAFIRSSGERTNFLTQRNEATGKYEVARITPARVIKSPLGDIKRFNNKPDADAAAARVGNAKVVPLTKYKGKAEQTFIVVEGISDTDVRVIKTNPSLVEFYDPVSYRKSATPDTREQFLRDNGIELKQPRFDPSDTKNSLVINETDFKDIDEDILPDLDDDGFDAETDEILSEIAEDLDDDSRKLIDDADKDLIEARDEAIALKAYAKCKRGG